MDCLFSYAPSFLATPRRNLLLTIHEEHQISISNLNFLPDSLNFCCQHSILSHHHSPAQRALPLHKLQTRGQVPPLLSRGGRALVPGQEASSGKVVTHAPNAASTCLRSLQNGFTSSSLAGDITTTTGAPVTHAAPFLHQAQKAIIGHITLKNAGTVFV